MELSEIVTIENVKLGMRVVRNPNDWRSKWRDDKRKPGTIIGYTDMDGFLVGENSKRKHKTDRITYENGPGWCVVCWDSGNKSIYPIGASNFLSSKWWRGGPCHSLLTQN